MTDHTFDPTAPGRTRRPVWQQLPNEVIVVLDLLACGTVLLLVGAVVFFVSLSPPPD